MSEFDDYIVHGEPGQKEKADAWQTMSILKELSLRNQFRYILL